MIDFENRWIISLHEAGHAIIGRALLGDEYKAELSANGGGLATPTRINPEKTHPVLLAIMSDAGHAAERLADEWPHPETETPEASAPKPPLPCPLPPDRLAAVVAFATDAQAVDKIGRYLGVSDDSLHHWRRFVRDMAVEQVERHAHEIVNAAYKLFRDGRVVITSSERGDAA